MAGHYDISGTFTSTGPSQPGARDIRVTQKTTAEIVAVLMTLDDKSLQSVIDGLDPAPGGGSVSSEIVVLAKAEQKRRQSAPVGPGGPGGGMPSVGPSAPGKGGVAKYVIGGGLVLGLGWLVLKAARGGGAGSRGHGGEDE